MLAAIGQNHATFPEFNDRENTLELIKNYICSPYHISKALKNDLEFVQALLEYRHWDYEWVLGWAGDAIRSNKEFILKAVAQDGYLFRYASEELRDDREVVLVALDHIDRRFRDYGAVLNHASDAIKSDREIVLKAVSRDGWELKYASEALKNDKEIVRATIQRSSWAFSHAGDRLKDDEEIVLEVVRKKGYAILHASSRLFNDKNFVLRAVEENSEAFKFISAEFKEDREVILTAGLAEKKAYRKGAAKNTNITALLFSREKRGKFFPGIP